MKGCLGYNSKVCVRNSVSVCVCLYSLCIFPQKIQLFSCRMKLAPFHRHFKSNQKTAAFLLFPPHTHLSILHTHMPMLLHHSVIYSGFHADLPLFIYLPNSLPLKLSTDLLQVKILSLCVAEKMVVCFDNHIKPASNVNLKLDFLPTPFQKDIKVNQNLRKVTEQRHYQTIQNQQPLSKLN